MNLPGRFFLYGVLMMIGVGFTMNILSAGEKVNHVAKGTWGGDHIGISVTDDGAKIEFDCAHGSIESLIPLDDNGGFDVTGVYVQEQGGPLRQGGQAERAAGYSGKVDGNHMSLTVKLKDAEKEIGKFTLELGKSPVIRKCD